MGDGRYDNARLVEGDQASFANPRAARHGGAGAAERRPHQRRHARDPRRLRATADRGSARSRHPWRRQGGRHQPQRLSRRPRRCTAESAAAPAAPAAPATGGPHATRRSRAGHRRPCRRRRATSSSKAYVGWWPTRISPMRGSISTGCVRSAQPTSAPRRRAASARNRAPSRGAHVVRGRDPRREAKIDPARMRRVAAEIGVKPGEPSR